MIYVLSDIHGNRQDFDSIMEQIELKQEDTLYVLGDVIDRYPYGIEILQTIMTMPNAKMLLGNHEYMMLRALGCPYDGPMDIANESFDDLSTLWLDYNGGIPTYLAWQELSESEQDEIVDYLHALPLNIDIEVNGRKFKLVHAAPVELYEEYAESDENTETFYTVWNRTTIKEMPEVDYTLVFGHTPTIRLQQVNPLKIYHHENLIGIDCGSGMPAPSLIRPWQGRLACIRLDDMKEFYAKRP